MGRCGTVRHAHALRQHGVAVEAVHRSHGQALLWQQGKLANKVYGAFTSTGTAHAAKRARWLSLANTFSHWGGILVPPGYTDPVQFRVGNPYGTSHVATTNDGPGEAELATVRYQVRRAIDVTATLKAGRRTSREVA